jgi:hypothetical protein
MNNVTDDKTSSVALSLFWYFVTWPARLLHSTSDLRKIDKESQWNCRDWAFYLNKWWNSFKNYVFFPPVALQSLKDLGRLTFRRFLELFRHMVGLLGRAISPSQGLYPHRTTRHKKTRTNIHALSGIRTHNPSNQPAKAHASNRTATVTGLLLSSEDK